MKNKQKIVSIVFLLALSIPLLLASSANATYYGTYYGYKAGDEYSFHTEMTRSTDTPTGDSSSTASQNYYIKILDVVENYSGHDIYISYTFVGTSGDPVIQSHMEGNVTSFTTGGSYSLAALFVTTDWDNRSKEWSDYVNSEYSGVPGYSIQSITHTNGEFSVTVNLDFDSTNSNVDFNGDGINDAYTGTLNHVIKYDSNGVLQSASLTSTITSPDKGTIKVNALTDRSTSSTTTSNDITQTLTIVVAGVVAVLTLGIGFFLGKRHVTKTPQMPPIQTP